MLHGPGGPYGAAFYSTVGFPASVNDATFLAAPRRAAPRGSMIRRKFSTATTGKLHDSLRFSVG